MTLIERMITDKINYCCFFILEGFNRTNYKIDLVYDN